MLAAVMALNGIEISPLGEKFLLVYATPQADQIKRIIAEQTTNHGTASEGKLDLRFSGTQLQQLAGVYSQLLGKPVDIAPSTPRPLFGMESLEPLNKAEAIQGIELLLRVNGLSVIAGTNGQFVIVPSALAERSMRPPGASGPK